MDAKGVVVGVGSSELDVDEAAEAGTGVVEADVTNVVELGLAGVVLVLVVGFDWVDGWDILSIDAMAADELGYINGCCGKKPADIAASICCCRKNWLCASNSGCSIKGLLMSTSPERASSGNLEALVWCSTDRIWISRVDASL